MIRNNHHLIQELNVRFVDLKTSANKSVVDNEDVEGKLLQLEQNAINTQIKYVSYLSAEKSEEYC